MHQEFIQVPFRKCIIFAYQELIQESVNLSIKRIDKCADTENQILHQRLKTGLHQATLTLAEPLQGPQVLTCLSYTLMRRFETKISFHVPKFKVVSNDFLLSGLYIPLVVLICFKPHFFISGHPIG